MSMQPNHEPVAHRFPFSLIAVAALVPLVGSVNLYSAAKATRRPMPII